MRTKDTCVATRPARQYSGGLIPAKSFPVVMVEVNITHNSTGEGRSRLIHIMDLNTNTSSTYNRAGCLTTQLRR